MGFIQLLYTPLKFVPFIQYFDTELTLNPDLLHQLILFFLSAGIVNHSGWGSVLSWYCKGTLTYFFTIWIQI